MIELVNICWKAGEFALKGVSCQFPSGQYSVLMGKTGCGKTSLLELICGLRDPHAGRIIVAGVDVTMTSPAARGVGYVPQDGALFPTMTVSEQIGFGLVVRRRPREEVAKVVASLAAELGVGHLLERKPAGLSGGEKAYCVAT